MTWAACFNNTQLLHLLWKHGATINHEDILLNAAASCIQYVFRFYHWKQTREPWTPKLYVFIVLQYVCHMYACHMQIWM